MRTARTALGLAPALGGLLTVEGCTPQKRQNLVRYEAPVRRDALRRCSAGGAEVVRDRT